MKTKMKGLLALCTIVVILVSILSVSTFAEETNIVLNKTAFGSTYFEEYAHSKANDGDLTAASMFHSGTTGEPAWLAFDLGQQYAIGRIEVVMRQDQDGADGIRSGFFVYGSNDSTFTNRTLLAQHDVASPVAPLGTWTVNITNSGTYRYLRIDRGDTIPGLVINEFRAFAKEATSTTPAPTTGQSTTAPTQSPDNNENPGDSFNIALIIIALISIGTVVTVSKRRIA